MPPGAATRIETARMVLRLPADADASALLGFFVRNRDHHRRWEPRMHESFYSVAAQRELIAKRLGEFAQGKSACFLAFDRATAEGEVAGRINFTEIVRGPLQACYLGYAIDRAYEGRGYMSEALRAAIDWAFAELRLHRIMANYRPENERSGRLLERMGFVREGYARDYLFIDGSWTDHVLTARLSDRSDFGGVA